MLTTLTTGTEKGEGGGRGKGEGMGVNGQVIITNIIYILLIKIMLMDFHQIIAFLLSFVF